MNTASQIRIVVATLALATACLIEPASLFGQGSLTPPPGPPAPVMKTLEQVEPRTPISSLPYEINETGSYYLTTNLTGVAGQNGITISASDVTLDLNGFALIGVPGSLSGVTLPSFRSTIAIRNGTVRNWGEHGIGAHRALNSQFEQLRASDNGSDGIAAGLYCAIRSCTSTRNGMFGITANEGSTVSACTASSNNAGIAVNSGTIRDCAAKGNGFIGISASYTVVSGCTSTENGIGFSAESGCTISGSAAHQNTDAGIRVTDNGNRIEGNHAVENERGIYVIGTGNLIVRNSAKDNVTNYDIVPGNKVGTITSDPTTAGPWANFEY